MKNLIWIVVLAGAAAVGYFVMIDGVEQTPSPAPIVKQEPPASDVEETSDVTVEGTAKKVVTDAKEKAEAMAEDAKGKVEDAAKVAVEGAMDKVEGMADTAKEAAADAAQDAVKAVAGTTDMADVFSVEGFDLGKVSEMIDSSGLDMVKKSTLKAALAQAGNSPELLKTALDTVKSALAQ